MADVPSFRSQRKRSIVFNLLRSASTSPTTFPTGTFSLGGATSVVGVTVAADGASGGTDLSVFNKLNLVDRVLPLQKGALVGYFDGALMQVVMSGLTSTVGNGTVGTVVIEGSVDGSTYSVIGVSSEVTAQASTVASKTDGTGSGVIGLFRINGPLPQFIRVKEISIATNALVSGTISVDFYLNG